MMQRNRFLEKINAAFRVFPITALLSPRQCGKTTLARMIRDSSPGKVHYFDLEDPEHLAGLANPKMALAPLEGLVIIDEIQGLPGIFPLLRVLADRTECKTRFLILGSASPGLIQQSSESLAGRIQYIELTPFSVHETLDQERCWIRGGFPLSFLPDAEEASVTWRKAFIATYLERDLPNLGINIPAATLRRFWMMIAHYHGNVINRSELARSMAVSDTTIRRYLDILSGTYMIRLLQPWHENLKKRQVKSPKLYMRDSGILHTLLGLPDKEQLLCHPKLGASWEGFALEEVTRILSADPGECYFWATHQGAELDLLILKNGRRYGFEFKYADAPKISTSMTIAIDNLGLACITIIYPGSRIYPLAPNITAMPLSEFVKNPGLENPA